MCHWQEDREVSIPIKIGLWPPGKQDSYICLGHMRRSSIGFCIYRNCPDLESPMPIMVSSDQG